MQKITHKINIFLFGSLPVFCFAQIPDIYKQITPVGWTVLSGAQGDLNKDSKNDIALILEKNQTDHPVLKDDGTALHNNQRKLAVFFKTAQGYKLAAENHTLPPAEQPNTCLLDPLSESEGITIHKGILSLELSYFMACGGWEWPRHTYIFRWQNQQFALIGFDYYSFHRASGEETNKSYNFSTKKRKEILGANMFENTQTQWTDFKSTANLTLQNINFDDFYTQFNY